MTIRAFNNQLFVPRTVASTLLTLMLALPVYADVFPDTVELVLERYESAPTITKSVTVPSVPTNVEVCLVTDVTGSFRDDIENLNAQIGSIVAIVSESETARFGVATFADYPVEPYGGSGDRPYTLVAELTDALSWRSAVAGLTIFYGNDSPESQLDAIYGAVNGLPGWGEYCGFSDSPDISKFIISSTDSGCHSPGPGKPHQYTVEDVIYTLTSRGITFLGLSANPSSRACFEPIANATGGSVESLYADGSNIQFRLRNAVADLKYDIEPVVFDDCPQLSVEFEPSILLDVVPGSEVEFRETVTLVEPITAPVTCRVAFAPAGTQTITVYPGVGDGRRPAPELCTEDATDTDGDGWGWEGYRTCIVAGSDPDLNRKPVHPTCTTSSFDIDGDGYGWEMETSCIVEVSSHETGHPLCRAAASDADGDGYGWEDSNTCIVAGSYPDRNRKPVLPGCIEPYVDPDGDGYGWKDNASCVIVSASP